MRDEGIKKLQKEPRAQKKVMFTQDYKKRRGPSHGYGKQTSRNDDNRSMMSTPQPYTRVTSGQIVRLLTTSDNINLLQEGTSRKTSITDTMITTHDQLPSQNKINPGIGKRTITIHDCLQRRDKTPPSRIPADNPDQIQLILQCLTDLETKTRASIYTTTRNYQPLVMDISQT